MMKVLHISHGKADSTIDKARLRFHWPVIDAEHIAGLRPMDEVAVDYGVYGGKNYLIMLDRASSYAICEETRQQTTADTIKVLDKWFDLYGPPRILRADDGPSF